jgi:hypothetical protein
MNKQEIGALFLYADGSKANNVQTGTRVQITPSLLAAEVEDRRGCAGKEGNTISERRLWYV